MSVDFGFFDRSVSQQFFNNINRNALYRKMARKRVPEGMWRGVDDIKCGQDRLKVPVNIVIIKPVSLMVQKTNWLPLLSALRHSRMAIASLQSGIVSSRFVPRGS